MASWLREGVAPAYLFLCLVLGGSAQGIWANMVLQLLGIGILAWAALAPAEEPLLPPARQLLILALLAVALVALQLVPLPASLWPHLPGREPIANGFRILGIATPAQPVSPAPQSSAKAVSSLTRPTPTTPSAATSSRRRRWSASQPSSAATTRSRSPSSAPTWARYPCSPAGIVALQVASSDYAASPWYLYPETNFGLATGFFANANHMAILLVITLPFLGAILGSAKGANKQRNSAMIAIVAGATLVIILGIILNRSLAGYGLALPVVITGALLVLPPKRPLRLGALVLALFDRTA